MAHALRLFPLALLLIAPLAVAQYKVVGPDGKISYTDQPPPADARRVQSIQLRGTPPSVPLADLPANLRPVATRYPVTLYAATGCQPCNAGRQLLQQRGIPYTERMVESAADGEALARLTGDRSLPVLTVGKQQLKGLTATEWHSYLDAAGYPKTSALPASYQTPAASPLTAPVAAAAAAPAASESTQANAPAEAKRAPGTPNIRF